MEKKTLYAILAILVVAVVVGAVVAIFVLAPPAAAKYPLELWYNNDGHYGDTEDELATVLKNSIESCGKVAVTLKSETWPVYRQKWAAGQMPLFLLGWYPDYFDSDDYISPFLSVSGARSLGSFYNNSQVDTWITEEQTTTDPAIRAARFTSIQNRLATDVPYVPLFSGNAHIAYINGITGLELHPVTFKWFIVDKPGATQLNTSTTDDVISFDPASAYDYFSIEVINQVFDTLLVYEPVNATLMPGLATEIPTLANGGISADGKNYTYHLRAGATFHDGTPFNASVMKRSLDRAIRLDIAGSAAFLLYDVGALGRDPSSGNNSTPGVIEVVDPLTIRFHLPRAVSFFNDLMAFSVAAPVPWLYSQTGEQPSTVPNVVGTGPYELTQHVEDTLVVLDKYAAYHTPSLYASKGVPIVPIEDRVVINLRGSATALKNDMVAKSVDVIYRTLTPADLTELLGRQTALGIPVDVGASPQIRYLVFNVDTSADARVRQAIAYSADRAAIDSIVFDGRGEPLYSMIPSNMPYHEPVFQDAYGDHDCPAANALFTLLGYSLGLDVRELIARDR